MIGTGKLLSASTQQDGTYLDTHIAVFAGTDCNELVCVVGDSSVPADCGTGSVVFWLSEEGEQYYVRVTGNDGSAGSFQLVIEDISNQNYTQNQRQNPL